jgi:hypothetical protein
MPYGDTIDLSLARHGRRSYNTGSLQIASMTVNGEYYLLKHSERNKRRTHPLQVTSYMNNATCEYIGSHIFASAGIPAQETFLARDGDGDVVVLCKDFKGRGDDVQLFEFGALCRFFYSGNEIGRTPPVSLVYDVIGRHYLLDGIRGAAIDRYWDTFVVDAMIGNFDRHLGNWGYLASTLSTDVSLAPVYDCGSALWPKIDDEKMDGILADPKEVDEFVLDFPKGQLRFAPGDTRHGFAEVLGGMSGDCTAALKRVYPRIDMGRVNDIVDSTPFITGERARFLKTILAGRHDRILAPAYEKAMAAERAAARPSDDGR